MALWIEWHPANHKVTVRFPVRARAWVAGQVLSWGHVSGSLWIQCFINVSLPCGERSSSIRVCHHCLLSGRVLSPHPKALPHFPQISAIKIEEITCMGAIQAVSGCYFPFNISNGNGTFQHPPCLPFMSSASCVLGLFPSLHTHHPLPSRWLQNGSSVGACPAYSPASD